MQWKKQITTITLALIVSACACDPVYIKPAPLPVGDDPIYPTLPTRFEKIGADHLKVKRTTMKAIVQKIGMQATRIDSLKATILGKHK